MKTAESAIESLMPLARDLAAALIPDAEWIYTRRGPTSCELKGEPDSYQYAHRFGIQAGAAPGGKLPAMHELQQRAENWFEDKQFVQTSSEEVQPDGALLILGSGSAGRVTIAAGPEAILVSVATHPLRSREVEAARGATVH